MRTFPRLFTPAALAAGILAPALAAQQAERHTVAGSQVAVYTLAGEVRVEAGTGPDVVVEVTRGGRDAGRLNILRGSITEMPGFETLRVAFPGEDIVYPGLSRGSRSDVQWRENGTWGGGGRNRRGPRQSITIGGGGSGVEAWADLRILVPAGKRVDVNVAVGRVSLTNVNGNISVDANSAPVTAQGARGALDIDVGSGSVTVSDMQGTLNIDTGSGEIDLRTFRGRALSLETGSGEVSASAVTADLLQIETGSGSITLTQAASPEMILETGSGDIDLDLTTDVITLSVETGSGSINLDVPATLGAMVDIETGSGGIETDLPLEVTRWGNDRVTGRIGDGQGQIDIETGSGRVRITKKA